MTMLHLFHEWQYVPKKLTQEMLRAFAKHINRASDRIGPPVFCADIWMELLTASPNPPDGPRTRIEALEKALETLLEIAELIVAEEHLPALDEARKLLNIDPVYAKIRMHLSRLCPKLPKSREAIESSTLDSLSLDSLDIRDLIVSLEDDYFQGFNGPMPLDEIDSKTTVAVVMAIINKKLEGKQK